jgi:tRNA(Ile2) C34 agmatinyltransferase TiaS
MLATFAEWVTVGIIGGVVAGLVSLAWLLVLMAIDWLQRRMGVPMCPDCARRLRDHGTTCPSCGPVSW